MPMIIAANANAQGSHVGEWRHPDAWDRPAANLANAVRLARIAEAGKLDLLFLADGNGVRNLDKPDLFTATSPSDRPGVFEPVTLLSALAMVTDHIGLVATTTTTYDEPFAVARRFASLDHISGGRAGWNLVTTSNPGDALNFSHDAHVARDDRYERAGEFAGIVKGLWDSWADDAFPQDKASGRFLDPSRVRPLDHVGKRFRVAGPLNAPRPPQGHPVIFSAGQSETGKELSAAHADCVFAIEGTIERAKILYADLKGRLSRHGRVPESLKILSGVTIFVGETEEEADRLMEELDALVPDAVAVDYLSKMLGTKMGAYALDDPMPDLPAEHVGPTGIGRAILAMAAAEGLTVRQTCRPHPAADGRQPVPRQRRAGRRPDGALVRGTGLRRLHGGGPGGADRDGALLPPGGARAATPRPVPHRIRRPHPAREPGPGPAGKPFLPAHREGR